MSKCKDPVSVALTVVDAVDTIEKVASGEMSLGEAPVQVGTDVVVGATVGNGLAKGIEKGANLVKGARRTEVNAPKLTRDSAGRLRDEKGRFAADPNKAPATKSDTTHGNKLGDQPAELYEKYSKKELAGGYVVVKEQGTRRSIAAKERDLVERKPGPENKEPWAGSKKDTKDDEEEDS